MRYPRKRARSHSKEGFSLIEVMLAMFVFSLVAIGITATVIQSQKVAQSNIFKNTAYTIVQGYLEQIKSISTYTILDAVSNDTSIPTVSIDALATGNVEVEDGLLVDQENEKDVMIDLQEGGEQVYMSLWITPTVNDLNTGSSPIPAIEIILDFEYEVRHLQGIARRSGSLRIVKAETNE